MLCDGTHTGQVEQAGNRPDAHLELLRVVAALTEHDSMPVTAQCGIHQKKQAMGNVVLHGLGISV